MLPENCEAHPSNAVGFVLQGGGGVPVVVRMTQRCGCGDFVRAVESNKGGIGDERLWVRLAVGG
jgi:hypothetical protein